MSGSKTEKPTPKKLDKAKEDGNVPRSRELSTLFVLLGFILGGVIFIPSIVSHLEIIFRISLGGTTVQFGNTKIAQYSGDLMLISLAFISWNAVFAYVGTIVLGGNIWSSKKLIPKIENLSIKKGAKKMISLNNLVESIKSIGKLVLIGSCSYIFIKSSFPTFIQVRWSERYQLMSYFNSTFEIYCFIILIIMAVFAAVDSPFQVLNHRNKLKMSLQDIKDEHKNSDGNPEVKGKMKQKQREISERKHIPNTKDATVILANPTHYSVAVYFDEIDHGAPVIVSMGSDHNALAIRTVAAEHSIPVVSIPPLARAIYKSGKIGHPIPEDFYEPVAMLLAYIIGLDDRLGFDSYYISNKIAFED